MRRAPHVAAERRGASRPYIQRTGKALLHVVVGDLLGRTHAKCQRLIRGVVGNVDLKQVQKENREAALGCVKISLRRFCAQKVGQAARETMLKFVGVSLALLESKEGVFPSRRGWATAGDKTSTVSSERSMARLRVSMFFYLGSLKRHTLWHTCPEPPMSQSKVSRAKVASAQLTILISASCSSTGKEHQT